MALGVGSISLITLMQYVMLSDYTSRRNGELVDKALKKVDINYVPEFEVESLYVGDDSYNIFLEYYYVCRGKAFALKNYVELGDKARNLSEITDSEGNPFFGCEDIAKYIRYGGKIEFADKMAAIVDKDGHNRFYGAQLPQYAALGLSSERITHLKDTEKPNGLFIDPAYDINSEGYEGSFRTPAGIRFFKDLDKIYDLEVVVASRKSEVCDAIDPAKDYKLLVISGHGNKTALQLGKECEQEKANCDNGNIMISAKDYDFSSCLEYLDKNAVIFLNSCSTAEGGRDTSNLANSMVRFALGKTVIASKIPFSQNQIKYDKNKLYPFDAQIIVDGKDQTYKVVEKIIITK